jgi:hypothetical protein
MICAGQSVTLTANGANTYSWSTASSATSIAVSPTVNTTYTLTGSNGQGCNSTVVYTQSVSACTNIKNVFNTQNEFQIYPNPSLGVFTITSDVSGTVIIYNAMGAEIEQLKLPAGPNTINLSSRPNGIYFVKCGSVIKKVIKE